MASRTPNAPIIAAAVIPPPQRQVHKPATAEANGRPQKKRKVGPRRAKYVARACDECQQRKVKCSGEDICYHCRTRKYSCIYSANDQDKGQVEAKRKRLIQDAKQTTAEVLVATKDPERAVQPTDLTLKERVRKLEEEVRTVGEYRKLGHLQAELKMDTQGICSKGDTEHRISTRSPKSGFKPPDIIWSSPSVNDGAATDSSGHSITVHPGEGETDTFEAAVLHGHGLSLSSQLTGLRSILGLGSVSSDMARKYHGSRSGLSLELPNPVQLRHLLDVYFRDFDCFLPYLDQSDTERRVFEVLEDLNYGEDYLKVSFEFEHCSLLALVCNMLAMAECLDPDQNTGEEGRPGWAKYVEGMKLVQRCSAPESIDMDVVRYYAVGSGYLMHSECLQAATHAISMAIQLATKVGLNNQIAWTDCSSVEVLCRKKLWWTIYFMDRRIGQKNGAPYLIRDSEVGVDDFSTDNLSSLKAWPHIQRHGSRNLRNLSQRSSESHDYLQVLIDLGKLWGQIWDSFFAVNAAKLGDWQEIEIMDTRLLFLQRHVPQSLSWDQEMASLYASSGEDEPQVRRRLATFARINTMRLVIRQNPLIKTQDDLETKRFCAELARRTIEAIAIFNRSFTNMRPSGYFATATLVECICHLVPLLQAQCLRADKAAAVDSFRTAYRILVDLARTMNGARRAVKALRIVFSVDESVSFFKSLVSETERITDATAEGRLQQDSQNQASGALPMAMGALEWPSDPNFFALPKANPCPAKAHAYDGPSKHTQIPDALMMQHPAQIYESPFDLEDFSMSRNENSAEEPAGELDFGPQDFIYGDIMADLFN